MAAIQNQINLYVNQNGQLVSGSQPTNFLFRNNLNRNIYFIITPLSQAAVVKLIFKNTSLSKQGFTGVALATTQKGKDITSETVSYYNLVKDWNVFKYVPSARILTKFPSTVTGSIALTVSIREIDLSDTTKWTFLYDVVTMSSEVIRDLEATPNSFVRFITSNVGWVDANGNETTLNAGDKLVNLNGVLTVIRALWLQSTTEPIMFVGNPSLEDNDFEDVEVGDVTLLDSIISIQNDQTISILQLQNFINWLNAQYTGLVVSVDEINRQIAILTGDILKKYPYFVITQSGTHNLNTLTEQGYHYFVGSPKTFSGGPVTGTILQPIMVQVIGTTKIYFDTLNDITYTKTSSGQWRNSRGMSFRSYTDTLGLGTLATNIDFNSRVFVDATQLEKIRTLLGDVVSIETVGSGATVYSVSLGNYLKTIAVQYNDPIQTKSSVAKYIDSLGLLDTLKLANLSGVHGLATGVPYLDGAIWKLDFADGETVVLEDLNMWEDTQGQIFIWFTNSAHNINFTPVVLPYEFSIEDDIDKKMELNLNRQSFSSTFDLSYIRLTLLDVDNGKDITDTVVNPEYNYVLEIDTTQGANGFIPFSYSNDNVQFDNYVNGLIHFRATERHSSLYKGRTTLALKITFNINGESRAIFQKVTINVTGVPVANLQPTGIDFATADITETGTYTNDTSLLRVSNDGTIIYEVLVNGTYRYRTYAVGESVSPWIILATLSDLTDFLKAEDLPDLLADYATKQYVDTQDANILSQAKYYTEQKVAEAVAADIIATPNLGYKGNSDFTDITLTPGMTMFDFATNTLYTRVGTAWLNPVVLTPQQNSEVVLGIYVGPITDVDMNGKPMRGNSVNAIYRDGQWIFFNQTTIINNTTASSDVIGIELISGTGSNVSPFVISQDFRLDATKKYFFYTSLTSFVMGGSMYFNYNGNTFTLATYTKLMGQGNAGSTVTNVAPVVMALYLQQGVGIRMTPIFRLYSITPSITQLLFDSTDGITLMAYRLLCGGTSGNNLQQITNGNVGTALKFNGPNAMPSADDLANMSYEGGQTLRDKIASIEFDGSKTLIPNRLGFVSSNFASVPDTYKFTAGTEHRHQLLLSKCWTFDTYHTRGQGILNKQFRVNNGKLWAYVANFIRQVIWSSMELDNNWSLANSINPQTLEVTQRYAFQSVIYSFFNKCPLFVLRASYFWSTRRARQLFDFNVTLEYLFANNGPVMGIMSQHGIVPQTYFGIAWVDNFYAWYSVMAQGFTNGGPNITFRKADIFVSYGNLGNIIMPTEQTRENISRGTMIPDQRPLSFPTYRQNYADILARIFANNKKMRPKFEGTSVIYSSGVIDLMFTMLSPFSFQFGVNQTNSSVSYNIRQLTRHQSLNYQVIRFRHSGNSMSLNYAVNSGDFDDAMRLFLPTRKIGVDRKNY